MPARRRNLWLHSRILRKADAVLAVTPDLQGLQGEIAGCTDLGAASPHHCLGISPRVDFHPEIGEFALAAIGAETNAYAAVERVGAAIHGWVPTSFFATYAGPGNPFAVPIAVVAGISRSARRGIIVKGGG